MESVWLNKDRLPQDAAVEQPGMASFARLYLAIPVSCPSLSCIFSYANLRLTKLALDTGWQYKGQSRDKVAGLFWDKCLTMPITIFKEH